MNEPLITYQILFKETPKHAWHINHRHSHQETVAGVCEAIATIRANHPDGIHEFKVERTTVKDVTAHFPCN